MKFDQAQGASLLDHVTELMISSRADTPTVFVIDDDEAVCRSLALTLDLEGYKVQTCATAESFLAQPLPATDAFIVVDQKLPGMSGIQALKILRDRGVDLPAAIITTLPSNDLRRAALSAQATILDKPLLADTLLTAVRAGLERHSTR